MQLHRFACAALFLFTSLAAQSAPAAKPGLPAVEGGFTLPKKTYFIGEAIVATFTVTNRGPGVLAFPVGGDYRSTGRHDRFSFTAVAEGGEAVGDPVRPGGMGGGLGGNASLKPGENHTEILAINRWCELTLPGKYTVTCRRVLNVMPPGELTPNVRDEDLPAIPIETVLKVEIVDQPAAQAAYIERLIVALPQRDAASQEAGEGLTILALLKIPAAFPAFVKLLDQPKFQQVAIGWLARYEQEEVAAVLAKHAPGLQPEGRAEALSVLSRWKDPAAEAIAAAALRDADAALRRTAVDACSRAKYPTCVPILLGMGSDPDAIVRRYLGYALGQSGNPLAIPVLQQLLKDPDPDPFIRIWAAGGLGALKRTDGVPVMIELLRDPKAQSAQGNVLSVLDQLTGQNFQSDRRRCLDWWEKEGRAKYDRP